MTRDPGSQPLWTKRNIRPVLKNAVIAGLALLLCNPYALGQAGGLEQRVRSFDTNHDGFITVEEFRGPAVKFNGVDSDQDGVISQDELDRYFSPNTGNLAAPETQPENLLPVTYSSTIDGAECTGSLWAPGAGKRAAGKIPLVVFLGGGQGAGTIPANVLAECQKRGWLALGLAGRTWEKGTVGDCGYTYSMAYMDHPDPAIGPGQQDILDGIDWALHNYPADRERVYLCGFSLGGRGTYMMGLKCPDRFAAIAPFAPATDMFELDIRTSTTRASYPCRMALAGGIVGTSERSATLRSIQSARFLLENAYNLPVFHGHGTQDGLAYNIPGDDRYMHGFSITTDSSWDGAYHFNGKTFGFGHTPTLSELHHRHPDGYRFAYMFTEIGHAIDTAWLTGAPSGSVQGVPNLEEPGHLLGAFDFFARQRLVHNPKTVVYKSYTDDLRKAYWLEIDIRHPWKNQPGAVRATRDIEKNLLTLEVAKLKQVTVDLEDAGLCCGPSTPLCIEAEVLNEPTFDPALRPSPGEPLNVTIALKKHGILKTGLDKLEVVRQTSGTIKPELHEDTILLHISGEAGERLGFTVRPRRVIP